MSSSGHLNYFQLRIYSQTQHEDVGKNMNGPGCSSSCTATSGMHSRDLEESMAGEYKTVGVLGAEEGVKG